MQHQFDFEQADQLKRVVSGIGAMVVEFFDSLEVGQEFSAAELNRFVLDRSGASAPGSSDRVMRELRKRGQISYELVSRSKSLYRKISTNYLEV